jgi:GNAT superfamily N-acetyltransferase
MEFREARNEDAAAACEVVRRSITELCYADHRGDRLTLDLWLANKTPENMRRRIENHYTIAATEVAAIIGVGMVANSGEVLLNYVSPDARFRGVSKGVMARLEARARDLGARTVTLQSSTTARPFYLSAGYRAAGPATKGFGITLCHPMSKHLA